MNANHVDAVVRGIAVVHEREPAFPHFQQSTKHSTCTVPSVSRHDMSATTHPRHTQVSATNILLSSFLILINDRWALCISQTRRIASFYLVYLLEFIIVWPLNVYASFVSLWTFRTYCSFVVFLHYREINLRSERRFSEGNKTICHSILTLSIVCGIQIEMHL